MNRSKKKGTEAESAVVRYLRTVGWPGAERRALAGHDDLGDVVGCPGLVWEVKAHKQYSDLDVAAWMGETETERVNAGADFGVLVVRRHGVGEGNAGRWWAYMPLQDAATLTAAVPDLSLGTLPLALRETPVRLFLADAVALLRAAGYGTAPEDGAA